MRISGVTKDLPRLRTRSLGMRNARPVRRQAVNSRRSAPRTLHVQSLVDRLVTNAHRSVFREINQQAMCDLFRAPGL